MEPGDTPLVGGAWGHAPGRWSLGILPGWVESGDTPWVGGAWGHSLGGWSLGTRPRVGWSLGTLPLGVEPGARPLVGWSLGHTSLVGVEPGTLPLRGSLRTLCPGGMEAEDTPAVAGWLGHSPWCRRLGTQRAESSGHCPILSAQLWKLRDLSWAVRPWEPRVSYGSPAFCPADTISPPLPLLPPPSSSSSLESVLGGWVRLNSLSRLKTLPSATPTPNLLYLSPEGPLSPLSTSQTYLYNALVTVLSWTALSL